MFIGDRIRKERINRNLSQQELGNLIGVSKVSISGYETGSKEPRLDKLVRLSETLKLSPSYILGMDKSVVSEKTENYNIIMSNEEIELVCELRKHKELYHKICLDPKRSIERIERIDRKM